MARNGQRTVLAYSIAGVKLCLDHRRARRFTLIRTQGCILPNVFLLGTENGAFVKRCHGQNKRYYTGDAHQDDRSNLFQYSSTSETHHLGRSEPSSRGFRSSTCEPLTSTGAHRRQRKIQPTRKPVVYWAHWARSQLVRTMVYSPGCR